MNLLKRLTKSAIATFLGVVLFVQAGLVLPQSAHAQLVTASPDVVGLLTQEAIDETIDEGQEAAKQSVFGAVVGGVTTALINIMSSYTEGLARDAAIAIATGDNGGKPLLEQRPATDYIIYAGATVAAEVIDGLNNSNVVDGRLEGFNVCAPPNLGSLRAGIAYQYQERELDICNGLDDLKANWGGFFQTARDNIQDPQTRNETILNTLSSTIDPGVNGVDASLSVFTSTLLESERQAGIQLDELFNNDGFYDVTNFLTGDVETPSTFVVEEYKDSRDSAVQLPGAIGANLIANSDALIQVGLNAAAVFTSTLLNQYSKKLTDGLFDALTLDDNPFDEFSPGGVSRDAAIQALRSVATFQPLDSTNFSLLSEMVSCPNSVRGTTRKLYNCVVDTNFATVIARGEGGIPLTLQEAIDEGLVNGNWRLIPETDKAANQDPNCYNYGFCHSNLVKLRKARVIPVGWELATTLPEAASGSLTLNEVMNGFNDCNEDNQRDALHPFCHLIDPNWVLKMPESSCRILAHGQLLEANGIAARAEECVDIQSCIAENEDGTCVGGYGYCVREKNVWRFRGDECPANAASCLSFTSRTGEAQNYLTSTVDQANCNEGNAGCLWYANQKEENSDGEFDWPVVIDTAATLADPDAYKQITYFNGSVEECSEGELGCTALIEKTEDTVLNLVQNSSFEEEEDGFARSWLSTDYVSAVYDTSRTEARVSSAAVNPGGGIIFQPGIALNSGSFYNLSFYARQGIPGAASTAQVALVLTDRNGNEANLDTISFDTDSCTLLDLDSSGVNDTIAIQVTPGDDYQRYDCLFTMPTFASGASVGVGILDISGIGFAPTNVWFDDIMLENNTTPSNFTEDYNFEFASLRQTHLKLPPASLNCDGSPDQPEECGNYSQLCTENDAGCTEYTPTNGDPSVNGIVNELDRCTAECVGYDTYKQEPTLYEPEGEFPVYFIPDSAEQCSQDAVGCDEFTNLDTEETEYFTYLRACVSDSQAGGQGSTFYTWEGSDTEGYQLRTWNLLESNITSLTSHTYASGFTEIQFGDAPCTTWKAGEFGIECSESLSDAIAASGDDCDEHEDIFNNPDCREFYDENGNIHYRNWRDTVTVGDSCSTYRKSTIAGLGNDANGNGVDDGAENCEASGGYMTDANECNYYGSSEESDECSESENGCREYTGGQSGNSRVVLDDNFEGGLTAWTTASAANVDLSNDSIAAGGNSLKAINGATVETFSYDNGGICTTPGGCPSGTDTLGGTCTVLEGEQYCGTLQGELLQGKTYTLTFWAKGDGDIDVGFDILSGGAAFFASGLELEPDWQRYSFGPLNMTEQDFPGFEDGSVLRFSSAGANEFFLDNIVLREGESNITIIRDSWVTPASCDENFEGTISPQFQLGCQEYSDQLGNTHYLKSFSRLCSENVVGCKAYFHTANSDNVESEIRNATCSTLDGLPVSSKTTCHLLQQAGAYDINSPAVCDIPPGESTCRFDLSFDYPDHLIGDSIVSHISYNADTERVQHDRTIFAVFDSQFACSQNAEACREFGIPEFSNDGSKVTEWTSTYLINDPDRYDEILCEDGDLFCEEWTGSDSSNWYFKHPQNRVCEYKTNVTAGGLQLSGWFRQGTTDLCYGTGSCSNSPSTGCSLDSDCTVIDGDPSATCNIDTGSFVIGGVESGIWKSGDIDYDGWVGACDGTNDGCSEFQDPLDYGEDEFYAQTDGEQYFFVDNENLDDNSVISGVQCDGQVSQRSGCVLFNDTGETGLDYSSSASLIASRNADELLGGQPFDLVDPIDCESGDSIIRTPSGEEIDLCANRCVYRKDTLYADFDDTTAVVSSVLDYYEIDGSCYVDSDCAPREADTGDIAPGRCRTDVFDPNGVLADENLPRLENDTNRVLKVNRDRVCSEWLEPSGERPVWDPAIGRYRNVSSAIDLCEAFVGEGDTTECAELVVNDPAAILDVERYTSRDVTWYGEEYAGYAIPEIYPVQHLSQVNIANNEKVCYSNLTQSFTGTICVDNNDCGGGATTSCLRPPDDYRLAYNAGECEVDHGSACTVGYCENTALPCSGDSQCGVSGGACITGQCVDSDGEETGTACGLDFSCPGADVCNVSVATIEGTCYRNQCVVSPQGNAFDVNTAEVQICRAYPEEDSPFSDDLVSQWIDGDNSVGTGEPYGTAPFEVLSGFENANFCTPGEDCLCSYRKIAAESNGPIYLDDEVETITNLGICVGGPAAGSPCRTNQSGTVRDCGVDDDADGFLDNGAECKPVDRVDTLYGLPGFCLERDTGINIQGDQDLGACVTWLPIDELQGTTDLYAKFLEAGYFEDTYACTETRPFANIRISDLEITNDNNNPTEGIACAELQAGVDGCTKGNSYDELTDSDGCWQNAECPSGFFAVVGQCAPDNWNVSVADQCRQSDNDCPYICVPEDSYHIPDTSDPFGDDEVFECLRPINDEAVQEAEDGLSIDTTPSTGFAGTTDGGTPVYYWAASSGDVPNQNDGGIEHMSAFNDVVSAYANCVLPGVDIEDIEEIYEFATHSDSTDFRCDRQASGTGYRCNFANLDVFPGCSEVTQVASAAGSGYPWTNRILGNENYSISDSDPKFQYTADSGSAPFGSSVVDPRSVELQEIPTPLRIGACQNNDFSSNLNYDATTSTAVGFFPGGTTASALVNDLEPPENITSCAAPFSDIGTSNLAFGLGVEGHDPSAPDLLTFIDFFWDGDDLNWSPTTSSFSNGGWTVNGEDKGDIFDRLTQVYAGLDIFSDSTDDVFVWDYGTWPNALDGEFDYEGNDADSVLGTSGEDFDVRGEEGSPPTVRAVDTDNCIGSRCEEGPEDTVTVNGQSSGDIFIEGDFLRVVTEFFAYADRNQLPIRRIIVDWQDGTTTGSSGTQNYYKNHRGLLAIDNSFSFCDETISGGEWGRTAASCDDEPLRYINSYVCTNSMTIEGGTVPECSFDADGNLEESPCRTDVGGQPSCAFQPRVHVRDNWGWCTGTCTAGTDGQLGCFEGTVDTLSNPSSTDFVAECAYQTYPDGIIPNDPWTYYDGVIYITP